MKYGLTIGATGLNATGRPSSHAMQISRSSIASRVALVVDGLHRQRQGQGRPTEFEQTRVFNEVTRQNVSN